MCLADILIIVICNLKISKNALSLRRFVLNVLSPGGFVTLDVLSLRIFFLLGHFVLQEVCFPGHFFPRDVLSLGRLCPWNIFSHGTFCFMVFLSPQDVMSVLRVFITLLYLENAVLFSHRFIFR
jgi:hypothetical protein